MEGSRAVSVTNEPRRARPGTTAALTDVCHVCHVQAIASSDTGAWTMACALCRRIDRRLAEDYGLAQCTPLWGGLRGLARPNLHSTLMRGPTFDDAVAALRAHHLAWCTAMAAAEGPGMLLADDGDPTGARITDWEAWQSAYPATPEAVVAAYQAYVRAVHPWIDSVEPRVADSRWLTGLLTR